MARPPGAAAPRTNRRERNRHGQAVQAKLEETVRIVDIKPCAIEAMANREILPELVLISGNAVPTNGRAFEDKPVLIQRRDEHG